MSDLQDVVWSWKRMNGLLDACEMRSVIVYHV